MGYPFKLFAARIEQRSFVDPRLCAFELGAKLKQYVLATIRRDKLNAYRQQIEPPVQKFLNIGQHSASTEKRGGDISGKPRIIDGDTIEISGTRIRLHGIDAPESAQRCEDADGKEWSCGKKATSALKGKIGWLASVSCEEKDTDRYGRMVAVCFLDGEDLNEWMVQNGWAVAYRRYSSDYASAEREAKYADRGIWAGEFEKPKNWRKKH